MKHLRLSGEESNSYRLCVANMLPMDFETRNTGNIWGEKERKTISQYFGALREVRELFAVRCVSCKENLLICKTPISLIQLLRIQSDLVLWNRHILLSTHVGEKKISDRLNTSGDRKKEWHGYVWCGELQLYLESYIHERNAVTPEIHHILREWCSSISGYWAVDVSVHDTKALLK